MSEEIKIKEVGINNLLDLCYVCIPEGKREDENWKKGIEEKRIWAEQMIEKFGSIAKIAYVNDEPVGMIQYRPLSDENVVKIDCIYVREKRFWKKGIGNMLINNLIEEMKKNHRWFNNKKPNALIVFTFPGHSQGQLSASEFFRKKGFKIIGDNPNHLYFPIKEGYIYKIKIVKEPEYKPNLEDKNKVLIFCGPNFCPAGFPVFLKRMEEYIKEVDYEIPIHFIDISKEKGMVKKRGVNYGDCVVNTRLIKTFVFNKEGFKKEVKEAMEEK